ncbi:hypothetical protein LOZ12_005995 [Ophidiomyces ophidiicola]|uniref:Uncharacterized protein n=1 Tax=Ophidiomyces ophidiicola TaxID=1387563 RepID=A0ACB8UTG3_9EURO|nr:uncharacterized protein LOZ57_005511 [Ophidiomyces ophidiicola]KAI1907881.1 hypothetical protein LOZ61_005893 [Ophidiomyces ophidiicola]KAI1923278.1 hypothetical protein LOZ60_005281 [Ophidiomyces ophidiicola]KAI1941720.1 hypothetical protein LOZ57_005511 [Ophidiomyces ophidiicola]KAI1942132.1 hypothetical protein LOZ62_004672 [Ophidiomyces ophidiicola]KAI1953060.1 hypothetical protein LOZ59_005296 [Ophidiomyces ophidiicola]
MNNRGGPIAGSSTEPGTEDRRVGVKGRVQTGPGVFPSISQGTPVIGDHVLVTGRLHKGRRAGCKVTAAQSQQLGVAADAQRQGARIPTITMLGNRLKLIGGHQTAGPSEMPTICGEIGQEAAGRRMVRWHRRGDEDVRCAAIGNAAITRVVR